MTAHACRPSSFRLAFTLLCLGIASIFFTGITAAYAATAAPRLNFGFISVNHPLVIYRQYQPFIDYINEQQATQYTLVLKHAYADVIDALRRGTLDVALLAGKTFMQAQQEADLIPIAAVLSSDGSPDTYSVFVVRDSNNTIHTLADLKGKKIAFGSVDSTASYLMPQYHLAKHSIFLDQFAAYEHLSSHDAVARAVLRGDVDAGAIGASLATRFLGQGLRIIAATERFPGFLIVARADVPKRERDELIRVLLKIPHSRTATSSPAQWPEIFRYGFGPVDTNRYAIFDTVRATLQQLEQSRP